MLQDKLLLIGQKLLENAKIQNLRCDILSNFLANSTYQKTEMTKYIQYLLSKRVHTLKFKLEMILHFAICSLLFLRVAFLEIMTHFWAHKNGPICKCGGCSTRHSKILPLSKSFLLNASCSWWYSSGWATNHAKTSFRWCVAKAVLVWQKKDCCNCTHNCNVCVCVTLAQKEG